MATRRANRAWTAPRSTKAERGPGGWIFVRANVIREFRRGARSRVDRLLPILLQGALDAFIKLGGEVAKQVSGFARARAPERAHPPRMPASLGAALR